MKIAVITGASSGMGYAFAEQIDGRLCRTDEIWLLARRREPMEELARTMQTKTRVVAIDLTDDRDLARFREVLALSGAKITLLVNCAGAGSYGAFAAQPEEDAGRTVRLNAEALTRLTGICLPYMRRGSRIVQFASGAAFVPQKHFAVYAASKAYVYSFGRALGRELKERGITVTTVCLGPVDTPFLDRAYTDRAQMGRLKRLTLVSPRRVVGKAIDDCIRGRAVSVCGMPMTALYAATQGIPNLLSGAMDAICGYGGGADRRRRQRNTREIRKT